MSDRTSDRPFTDPSDAVPSVRSVLAAHGWDEHWERTFAEHAAPGSVPGRVLRAERGACRVVTSGGVLRVEQAARPAEPASAPTTGDWLAVLPPGDGTPARPAALLPRRTEVARGGADGTSRRQVLAANVDTLVITVSLASPLRHTRTERLLALAWESGARPVIALTKADAAAGADAALLQLHDIALGVDVVLTSAVTGIGLDVLRAVATGTVALIGPSGAGKSSLGNALLGEDLLDTGHVREADGRGRHTTAWRELLPLPGGGVLLDTPGLRSVTLTGADEGLERAFFDIEELATRCRFADCAHRTEPGCGVLAALEDGRLSDRRLQSYRRLLRENAWQAARTDARLRAEQGDRWKAIARARRGRIKEIRRRDPGR